MRTLLRSLPGGLPLICLLLVLPGGCISTGESAIALDPEETLPIGDVVVFGKFTGVDYEGNETDFGSPLHISLALIGYRKEHVLYVVDEARQHLYGYSLRDDGTFLWHLPPGAYEICKYSDVSGCMALSQYIRLAFTVPPGSRPIYIGEYRQRESGGSGSPVVLNRLEEASAALSDRFPETCGPPKVSLMRIETVTP